MLLVENIDRFSIKVFFEILYTLVIQVDCISIGVGTLPTITYYYTFFCVDVKKKKLYKILSMCLYVGKLHIETYFSLPHVTNFYIIFISRQKIYFSDKTEVGRYTCDGVLYLPYKKKKVLLFVRHLHTLSKINLQNIPGNRPANSFNAIQKIIIHKSSHS